MPSTPLTIPSRPSIISLAPFSTSLDDLRVSEPTFIPSSPSTPMILSSSCSSASTLSGQIRRSSSISTNISSSISKPITRRGSSLPSIPCSSSTMKTKTTNITSYELENHQIPSCSSSRNVIQRGGSGSSMDILQFIELTTQPSWEEIESSPLSMVPNILPTSNTNIDLITFLREAPGVIKSPMSNLSTSSFNDSLNFDYNNEDGNDDRINRNKEDLVTPDLNQISLLTFLEEEDSHFDDNDLCFNNSFNSIKLNNRISSKIELNSQEIRNSSRSSSFGEKISRSSTIKSQTYQNSKRIVSLNSLLKDNVQKHNRSISNTSVNLKSRSSDNESYGPLSISVESRSHSVGRVIKLAKDAFKIGNNNNSR
ncbi:uncharacterized protein I206_101526 [Kwoniella pini CBS 10737]|uniref:Uncharacterized protein n=1 Tax=Kwoniella pini CBS 10737 TaxID=1296096 RepID=A0A1B9HWH9_9TREE|nr:uncharacterized protein I206_06501 [Kwoniella pini CBS 10737]OCF47598.1 hypothetical protein I206_06501 [Kwoniella pini CBS 10737]